MLLESIFRRLFIKKPYRHTFNKRTVFDESSVIYSILKKMPWKKGDKKSIPEEEGITYSQLLKMKKQKKVGKYDLKRPGHFNISAYATAGEYNLAELVKGMKQLGLYIPSELTSDDRLESAVTHSIHGVAKYVISEENRHVYFFREGTTVIWNCTDIEQYSILKFLRPYEIKRYDPKVILEENEDMTYAYETSSADTCITNAVMQIAAWDRTYEDIASDRYTLSNAMALSVKLGVLETLLDRYAQEIEPVTQDLRLGRPVSISKQGVLKKSGELFTIRHSLNLSSDLLDTPDFYWDREYLEDLFQMACTYFSISRRTKILNDKLSHVLDLITLLSTHLSDRHHVRLEWMIIILIMVEVGIEIVYNVKK